MSAPSASAVERANLLYRDWAERNRHAAADLSQYSYAIDDLMARIARALDATPAPAQDTNATCFPDPRLDEPPLPPAAAGDSSEIRFHARCEPLSFPSDWTAEQHDVFWADYWRNY